MKPASGKRTGGCASGRARGHGLACLPISAIRIPTCSGPSARSAVPVPPWSCQPPIPRPCNCISKRSAACRPQSSCRRVDGSGGLAQYRQTQGADKHHHHSAAVEVPRAEPRGKHLAVPASQLAFKPCLRNLRRHRRGRLRGMEQPHRSAGYHRINRDERLGTYGSIISDVGINRFIQGFLIACLVLAHGFLYRFDPVGK